jgi:hypothetical protein
MSTAFLILRVLTLTCAGICFVSATWEIVHGLRFGFPTFLGYVLFPQRLALRPWSCIFLVYSVACALLALFFQLPSLWADFVRALNK